jgi:hypothetical protein
MTKPVTNEELSALKAALSYDKDTGAFVWAYKVNRKCHAGAPAGNFKPNGYHKVGFGYREHFGHRLAWMFVNGLIPDGYEIDHIDGNPSNNVISNLRLATHSQNGQNKGRAISSNVTSGMLGVSLHKKTQLWRARIYVGGKEKSLGYFKDKMAAFEAYKSAKSQFHFTGAMA